MKVKNKYVIRSRISEAKLSRQTINKYLTAIRLRILESLEKSRLSCHDSYLIKIT
jgi:hypothetical protein